MSSNPMPKSNKGLALCSIALFSLSLGGCDFFAETKIINSGQSSSSSIGDLGPGTVGIKNAAQISVAMSRVTGVAQTESFNGGPRMKDQTTIIKGWLSGDGTVESLNSTMQLTITGLAGSFCRRFLEKEAGNATASTRLAHASVNFANGTTALDNATVDAVATKYHELFLRRAPAADELQAIRDEVGLAIPAVNALALTNSEKAQRTLLVPCTAVLGGMEFLSL